MHEIVRQTFGRLQSLNPEAFGFFYCKIKTPNDLKYPVLQTHVKTKDGLRTMAALGQYEDILFSEEMDNAKRFGYTFEILQGYKYKKGNLFKKYVEKMYTLRLHHAKDTPMNC